MCEWSLYKYSYGQLNKNKIVHTSECVYMLIKSIK